jgi:hypothetical protein
MPTVGDALPWEYALVDMNHVPQCGYCKAIDLEREPETNVLRCKCGVRMLEPDETAIARLTQEVAQLRKQLTQRQTER